MVARVAIIDRSAAVITRSVVIGVGVAGRCDRKTGRETYKVTAVNSTGDPSLYQAMPYLVRSALANFPLGNGTVRTVTLPVDQHGGISNETAAVGSNERSAAPAPATKAVD